MNPFFQIIKKISNYQLFTVGEQPISLVTVAHLLMLLMIVFLIGKLIQRICQKWLLEKLKFDVGNREAIATLIFYFTITLGSVIALQSTGLNLASLAVVVGGLGIGIGFGLQSIARDFISGLILLMGRSIKTDDFVEFGNRQEFASLQGTVNKISLLFTIIETKDSGFLMVPNSYLVTYPILNWSYGNKLNRIKISLRVSKNIDFVLFTEIILDTAHREVSVLDYPLPKLIFKEIADYYCEFELQVWINNIKNEDFIKTRLNYGFEYYLKQQGIALICPSQPISLTYPTESLPIALEKLQELSTSAVNLEDNQPIRKPLSVRDTLRKVSYFSNLTDLEIRQLIEAGYRQKLQPETLLFNEGDPGDAFYIILSGSVEIFVPKINKHLATLQTGSFFGELSLILGIPRTASVKAIEKTLLFVISKTRFHKILQEQSELAEVILQELEKHQEELSQRQEQLRVMGLIPEDEDDVNLMTWVRNRFYNLFNL